jgi:hypothetical protein
MPALTFLHLGGMMFQSRFQEVTMSSSFLSACTWLESHPELLEAEACRIAAEGYVKAKTGIYGRPMSGARACLTSRLKQIRKLKTSASACDRDAGEALLKKVENRFLRRVRAEVRALKKTQ